jgi:hypothetical protein
MSPNARDYTVWALSVPDGADVEETWVEAISPPPVPADVRRGRGAEIAALDLGFETVDPDYAQIAQDNDSTPETAYERFRDEVLMSDGAIELDVFGGEVVSLTFAYADAPDPAALADRVLAVLRALRQRFGWRAYDPLAGELDLDGDLRQALDEGLATAAELDARPPSRPRRRWWRRLR